MKQDLPIDSKVHKKIFLILLITLLVVFVVMMLPYLNAIILAYISALIMYPLYKKIYIKLPHKRKKRTVIAVTITIVLAVLIILIPILVILSVAALQATQLATDISKALNYSTFQNAINSVNDIIVNLPFKNIPTITPEMIATFVKSVSNAFVSFLTTAIPRWGSSAITFVTNLIIYIILLTYMIPNVKNIYDFALKVLPLSKKHTRLFLDTANGITVDMIKGTFIVALAQGGLVWLMFIVLGTPYTMLLTLIATILAIIPYVGTSFVTIPVAIIYAISGNWLYAILIVAWQFGVVSIIDNVIRSKILANKSKANLPLALLGILGGMKMFGILGLIYGPLIVTLLLTTIEIYTHEILHVEFEKEKLD